MTEYIILRRIKDDLMEESDWIVYDGIVEASSARRAIAVGEVGSGHYVAIPYRSWKPLIVKVEETTKVTIG